MQTVDTLKSGKPTNEIRGIAIGWMGYTCGLQKASGLMFITHVPTGRDDWIWIHLLSFNKTEQMDHDIFERTLAVIEH